MKIGNGGSFTAINFVLCTVYIIQLIFLMTERIARIEDKMFNFKFWYINLSIVITVCEVNSLFLHTTKS